MSDTDTRESVDINMPNDVLFDLMLMAHERDITLNQLIAEILTEQLAREQDHVDGD